MYPSADLSATVWRKSSKSTATGNECLELAAMAGLVTVRDSVDPDGPRLDFTPSAWRELTARIKDGELSL